MLKHECAYCLGQMQDPSAINSLIDVLKNSSEDPMVRHEAGEALGAIGLKTTQVVDVLNQYSKDVHPEVAETCQRNIYFHIQSYRIFANTFFYCYQYLSKINE